MRLINAFKIILCFIAFSYTIGISEISHAQSYILPDKQCHSHYCAQVYEQVRNGKYDTMRTSSGTREEKNQCYLDDAIVGKKISSAAYYIDKHDEMFGGKMLHETANNIRSLIFNETYEIRNKIQQLIYYGDVSKCHDARDAAINIIDSIMMTYK